MPRYIDLDKLNEYPIRLNHYDKENGNVNFVYGIESVLEYANSLPVFETDITQNWISVKDRMPEMNRDVIGFCASKEPELLDGVIEIVYLKDTFNFLGERKVTPYWCCDVREFFRTNYEVTHWMPLPEPPPKEV